MRRLLRTWSGRAVFATALIWPIFGISFLAAGEEQDRLFETSLGLVAFGSLFVGGSFWRDDDPSSEPRTLGVWGSWDWRPDSLLVGGAFLLVVAIVGLLSSLI